MNHGVVCWGKEPAASAIWTMAMNCRQYVAIYTSRDHETDSTNPWNVTFVHSLGEPAVLDPKGYVLNPGLRHPTGEVARYEPEHNEQFLAMVQSFRHFGVVVLDKVRDDEALRLWSEWNSALPEFNMRIDERIFLPQRRWSPHRPKTQPDRSHDKRESSEYRLRDVIRPIVLKEGWAFFLNFYRDPIVAFLSNDPNDVKTVGAAGNRSHAGEQ